MIRTEPSPAHNQAHLRRQIARLEALQAQRIATVRELKRELNQTITHAQNELDNLKAQQTIGVAR